MQYIDRGVEPPPKTLTSNVARMLRDNLRFFMEESEEKRSQASPPSSSLNYKQGGMQEALSRLFKGKCAFCESIADTEVWQFRPVTEALPYTKSEYAHLYYCWLELAWQNFYSICRSCIPKERSYFPVRGSRAEIPELAMFHRYADSNNGLWPPESYPPKESPLLLDPCQDSNLHRILSIGLDGVLRSDYQKGTTTIEHFNLNAPKLIDARRARHADSLSRIRRALQNDRGLNLSSQLFRFGEQEYGGTWYILLRRLAQIMGRRSGLRPDLSRAKIGNSIQRLCSRDDGFHLFSSSERELERQDRSQQLISHHPRLQRPSQSRLAEIELQNFKSIEQLRLAVPKPADAQAQRHLAPALLILGENGAGKSSILEAVALTLAPAWARDAMKLQDRDFILSPDHFGDSDTPPLSQAQVTITLVDGQISHQKQLHLGVVQRVANVQESDEEVPVFAYGAFRKYGSGFARGASALHIHNLFDSKDLANPEKWLLRLSPERFAMVARALRVVFSIDGDFEVISRDEAKGQCFLITAVDSNKMPVSQIPLRMASSGFRSVLAMMCDIMRGLMNKKIYRGFESLSTARGVVLVDEIEAHLHPRWKMSIITAIRRTLPEMTFIFTTHDPLCLRGMADGEVAVIRRAHLTQGTTIGGLRTVVEVLSEIPPLSLYGIEQLLTSDLFQLNSTDDPEIEDHMANIARLLNSGDLDATQLRVVEKFKQEIASAMPVGTSEAQRIVQEAVAEYIQERTNMRARLLTNERTKVKQRIIEALRGAN